MEKQNTTVIFVTRYKLPETVASLETIVPAYMSRNLVINL